MNDEPTLPNSDRDGEETDFGSTRRPFRIACPNCLGSFQADPDSDLSRLSCPKCGSRFSLVQSESATQTTVAHSHPNETLAHFELIEELGAGGFGRVWLARDCKLDRTVAVKIPHQRRIDSGNAEMFFREARAAASLQHPNIVSVFEIGRENNQIYIVSEYIRGVTLASWLTGRTASPRDAAQICITLAEALQHAHESGVIHRDLKPSNILIDGNETPRITDFGLAKRESGDPTLTIDGKILGTPAYMSPEQALGLAHHVTGQADIYSLGVILYELLTSTRPFRGNTQMILHQVIHADAPPARHLNRNIPLDLEAICMRCLEKETKNRYSTAADLADDLKRFLHGQPVSARRVTKLNRAWRWCKRNPVVAGLSAGLIAVLLVGLASTTTLWQEAVVAAGQARNALEDAKESRAAQRLNLFNAHMEMVRQALNQGDVISARRMLSEYIPASSEEEDLRGFVWHLWWGRCQRHSLILDHGANVRAVEFFPDDSMLATAGANQQIRIWDLHSGKLIKTFATDRMNRGCEIAISPDSKWIAATGDQNRVHVWDWSSSDEPVVLAMNAMDVAFSNDSKRLICIGRDGSVSQFVAESWAQQPANRSKKMATSAAFLETGSNHAIVANRRGFIFNRNIDRDTVDEFPSDKLESVWSLALTPDGQTIAAGYVDEIRLLDADTGRLLKTLQGHTGPIGSLVFSKDGQTLASACNDGNVKLWDVETGDLKSTYAEHVSFVANGLVKFSSSGNQLASASSDGTVKLWPFSDDDPKELLTQHADRVESVAFNPDNTHLISASADQTIQVWDLKSDTVVRRLSGHTDAVFDASIAPDGKTIASAGNDHSVRLWDFDSGKQIHEFSGHSNGVFSVAFSPGGSLLASGGVDRSARIWSVESKKELQALDDHQGGVRDVLFLSDERLATASTDGTVRIFDCSNGQLLSKLSGHVGGVRCLALSLDGKLLGSGGDDRTVRIWDLASGEVIRELTGQGGVVNSVSFCADGTTLATGGQDRIVRLWDLRTGETKSFLDYRGSAKQILSVAFSPDGKTLASGNLDASIRVWRSRSGYESVAQ